MGVCRQKPRQQHFYIVIIILLILYLLYLMVPCDSGSKVVMVPKEGSKFIIDKDHNAIAYDDNMPIIFVGGMPRSGTTLMRAMLDAHPEIRCGEETRVIPRILGMRLQWEKSAQEKKRLDEAGVTSDVLDSAIRSFILEIIAKHGAPAPHLCNKDPFTLKSTVYLSKQFPQSKFILMIRDGRAVVHSMITRKVTISGFDLTSYRKCLQKWNTAVETMYGQCLHVGPYRCLPVYYEQLVLHPKEWMVRILEFLNIPWNESVLHHEEFVGKPGELRCPKWNTEVESSYAECLNMGPRKCLMVFYEQLVLYPKDVMVEIFQFLNISWDTSVLDGHTFLVNPNTIVLSKAEKSTDQVIKPVNIEALSQWVGSIPDDVVKDMELLAPMLRTLGYDPLANPPNYGNPDPNVADNTLHIKKKADFWKQRELDILKYGADDGPASEKLRRQGTSVEEHALQDTDTVDRLPEKESNS